jgi:DNA-binding CsgD family transcriptional regulator
MNVRLAQVRQLIGLFEQARELAGREAQRTHLLDGLIRIVGATAGAIATARDFRVGGRIEPDEAVLANFEDPDRRVVLDVYFAMGGKIDPGVAGYADLVSAGAPGEVGPLRRPEIIANRLWYGSTIVAEVLKPAKLDDFIMSARPTGRPTTFDTVTLYRAPQETAFDEEDCSLILLFHLEMERLSAESSRRDCVAALANNEALAVLAARHSLTPAETTVLGQLALGLPNREIARRLFVSFETVRTHVQRVLGKLGVASRVRAALLVHQSSR